ncbi:hypothetical protein RUM44_012171 [Polyplax serrata]|uniref:Uncharacterized protein n=1 Tax=Polyplax serrata TaxID=468196 RepID=A0ABR1BEB4_POLSC
MKFIGLSSAACLLVCCAIALTLSTCAAEQSDDHPILTDILKFVVSYFNTGSAVVKSEGLERLMGSIFGNDTWEVDINFYYKHKDTDCNISVRVNEDSVRIDKLQCLPVRDN